MPIPKPRKSETKIEDWMARCMDDEFMRDEFPHEQRVSVCLNVWEHRNDPPKKSPNYSTEESIGMDGLNRAYAIITEKAVDGDRRVFRGMATTPTPDRIGDVVDPMGAKYRNPLPLLHQHDRQSPIGHVKLLKATEDGIQFEAEIPVIHEPGLLKDRVDLAWAEIKAGLVRAVSIGFRPFKDGYEVLKTGGLLFKSYEIIELSAVTIPANADCSIALVKSIDTALLTASGQTQAVDTPTPPGVSGSKKHPVKAKEARHKMAKTYSEQIKDFEASLFAKNQRREEIQRLVADEGRTKSAEEREEFETLADEIKEYEAELRDLRAMEKVNVAAAVAVEAVVDTKTASTVRAGVPATVRSAGLPKGTGFTRYAMALARAKGNLMQAHEISKQWTDTPEVEEVLKAAVAAGTTTDATWAAPLVNYTVMAGEFIDYLRPMTIIGRTPGFRMVPFNVRMPSQTSGSTVNWVGEGAVKPLSALAFSTVSLTYTKVAGIVVLTDELVRFSNPSAEAVVRQDLAASIAAFLDVQFIDPTKAAQTGVAPASITNGVTPVTATGTTPAALRADLTTLMTSFASNNIDLSGAVWYMTNQQAMRIAMMRNTLGQEDFPGATVQGGTLYGMPIIASEAVPGTGGSPTDGSLIILAKPSEIMLADDGGVTLDASREASLMMDGAPDSPESASSVSVSLWQHNMVGLRAERYINWAKRRSTAVAFIQNAKYVDD